MRQRRALIDLEEDEREELNNLCIESNQTLEQLLRQSLMPLQEQISQSRGQPIVAITRVYGGEDQSGNPSQFDEETIHAGVINRRTTICPKRMLEFLFSGYFLLNVTRPHILIDNENSADWKPERDDKFHYLVGFADYRDVSAFLYFRDRPPIPDRDTPTDYLPCDNPRLELHIGEPAVSYLEKRLQTHQYLQLAKLLRGKLPVSDEIQGGLTGDLLSTYDGLQALIAKYNQLVTRKDEGVRRAENHEDQTIDAPAVMMTENPGIRQVARRILGMLGLVSSRGYQLVDKTITRHPQPGVRETINFRQYFTEALKRAEEYRQSANL